MRAAEKGYWVGVMESGKRWKDEDIADTNWDIHKYLWQPEIEMFGIQRLEYLDDVFVLCGAGVGGGSHVYANTLYTPPQRFFEAAEWSENANIFQLLKRPKLHDKVSRLETVMH